MFVSILLFQISFIYLQCQNNKLSNMKYIAYYRVSTKRQSLGLDAQRNSVMNFINSNPKDELIAEYSEKESGKNDNRIQLQIAIAECKKNNAVLVIAKLDRLSRKVSFIFALRDSGIQFIALDVPNFNTLTLGIFATLAQTERELISCRTKSALAALKNNGVKLGNPNASFSPETRQLAYLAHSAAAEANENNKRALSMVKVLLKTTHNLTAIAKQLNDNGFLTSRGKQFNPIQVKRLIERI